MHATAVALAVLLQQCAPNVGPRTMTAIVRVESNGNPLAIHDNTTDRSFVPRTTSAAETIARALLGAGHSLDLGLAQVNSANLPRLGLRVHDVFDPCRNLQAGAAILSTAYAAAASRFSPGPYALRRAIGAYNTGSLFAGDAYIERILAAAGLHAQNERRIPDLEATAQLVPVPLVRLLSTQPPQANAYAKAVPRPQPVRAPQPTAARPVQLPAAQPVQPDPFTSAVLVTNEAPKPSDDQRTTATTPQ